MGAEPLELNYRRWGSGEPLIIIHGLFGSVMNWQTVGKRLARNWRVYALDMRNHGDSAHTSEFSYDLLAQDLKDFMDRQGIGTAVVMGHSLGGKVGMTFADRFPQNVERLIILDIAPKPYPTAHQGMLRALRDLDLERIKSRQEAFDELAAEIPDPATRHFLLKNLLRSADGRYRWRINLAAIEAHLDELSQGPRLSNRFAKPTLFIRGGLSGYITDEDAPLIAKYYPGARIVTIEGAGHWLHADAKKQTLQAIEGFLNSEA